MKQHWSSLLATLLALVAVVRIASTYRVFSHSWDEPIHIGAGMQLLSKGEYSYELQHPPLARLAVALGPYLGGIRSRERVRGTPEGLALLYRTGSYDRLLCRARAGTLPFFLLTLAVTWLWTRRLCGPAAALVAVLLLTTLPPLLGHAGLAMTDVALLGTCLAALYVLTLWLEKPSRTNGALLGLTGALAVTSKFSAIPFLGAALIVVLLLRWWRLRRAGAPWRLLAGRGWQGLLLGLLFAVGTFWTVYGFRSDFVNLVQGGIQALLHHNKWGHKSFLLGQIGSEGWWHYYLVALAVKTPIPFLVLGLPGAVMLVRRGMRAGDWRPAAPVVMAFGILAFSMTSRINIGVRHVLILYPLLAIGAAEAAVTLLRLWGPSGGRRVAATLPALLLVWQVGDSAAAHPDYVADFNLLAGDRPEAVLMPSDLDAGLDVKRLAAEVERRRIKEIHVYTGGRIRMQRHIPGAKRLAGRRRVSGWVAISVWMREAKGNAFTWLHDYQPVMRIGRSIDLYYIPPDDVAGKDSPIGPTRR